MVNNLIKIQLALTVLAFSVVGIIWCVHHSRTGDYVECNTNQTMKVMQHPSDKAPDGSIGYTVTWCLP